MTIQEIADKYVSMLRSGKDQEVYEELYSDNPVSIEMPGSPFEVSNGFDDIAKKGQWWQDNMEMHGVEVSDPIVASNHFAVVFDMDVTNKLTGERNKDSEVAILTVKDGKIVQEQFFYPTGQEQEVNTTKSCCGSATDCDCDSGSSCSCEGDCSC